MWWKEIICTGSFKLLLLMMLNVNQMVFICGYAICDSYLIKLMLLEGCICIAKSKILALVHGGWARLPIPCFKWVCMYTSLHSRHKLVTCESFDVNRGIFTGDKPMAVRHEFIFSETTTSSSGSDTEDGDGTADASFWFFISFLHVGHNFWPGFTSFFVSSIR